MKNRVSKNGNIICEHNLHSLKYSLIEHDQAFSFHTLKKKEQKRARKNDGHFQDFYKRKKILQITFFS